VLIDELPPFISAVMTADAALMTRVMQEEQQHSKLLMARLNELLNINQVNGCQK